VIFAGEASSSEHTWIIGALNSAYKAVAEVLAVEGRADKLHEFVDIWGSSMRWRWAGMLMVLWIREES
jgi:hypothetical protein